MVERKINTQVAVFGLGAMGQWTLKTLADQGIHAVGFDSAEAIATGSSTRNVRVLRTGIHDLVNKDVSDFAQAEAQRARRSYDAIKGIAPKATSPHRRTTAVFFDNPRLADQQTITERWRAENMPFEVVSPQDFRDANSEVGIPTSDIVFAATIDDAVIDSHAVYSNLQRYIVGKGGSIFTNAELKDGRVDGRVATVMIEGEETTVEADAFIATAGYGANDIYRTVVDSKGDLPLRYGRAYVLGTPRLTTHSLLPFGRNIPSISTTDQVSLFQYGITGGLTEPDFTIPSEKEEAILEAVQQLVPDGDLRIRNLHACMTIDTMQVPGISPDGKTVTYGRWTFAWPGMMTVAPDVAMQLVEGLHLPEPTEADRRHYFRRPPQYASISPYPTESALFAGAR